MLGFSPYVTFKIKKAKPYNRGLEQELHLLISPEKCTFFTDWAFISKYNLSAANIQASLT